MKSNLSAIRNISLCVVPGLEPPSSFPKDNFSSIIPDDDLKGRPKRTAISKYDRSVICQLLTHIPDSVINQDQMVTMPARKECIGVAMFADISGFTALCEKYADMVKKDSGCGTDKLTATLNNYIGKIVDHIIRDGGDVLKFAGDAILASWVFSQSGHNIKTVLAKAIRCGLAIQEKCDNQLTEVGVLLRVKIAMAVGSMVITFVGEKEAKQFDLSGSAIDEVGAAEKHASPSDVLLTHLAWSNCDQDVFKVKKLDDFMYYKVSENKRIVEKSTVAHGLVSAVSGISSEIRYSDWTSVKKVVICPEVDELIAQCPECHYDLPKALLPDTEDSEIHQFRPAKVVGRENRQTNVNKDTKFDRMKMNFNLDDEQVQELRSYVATPVLDKLDHGQDLEWLSEMRQVSVLFINMKLPDTSDDAACALQKAFEIIYEATTKFQGNLNKVFSFDKGCTFVVIFGLPGAKHEDDAARALRSGHMIYESLHAVAEITDESIGVTTGRAFCGVVGHKDRHEYTVIGRKVNMAARLMVNYPGKLSCDPDTYEAAKSKLKRTDFTTLPSKPLKGIKDPGVIREFNPTASAQDDEKEYEYPLLGRESETMNLAAILRSAKESKIASNVITIEGEAGIGKTRLLEEVMDMAEEEGFRLNYLELDSSQSLTPFYVIGNFISSLLGLEHCRCNLEKEHILFDIVQDEGLRDDLSLFNDLVGTEIPTNPKFVNMSDDERNECFHNLLFHVVQLVTESRPNIFVIDNAQFIDAESWEFCLDFVTDSHAVLALALRSFTSSNPAPCEAAVGLLTHIKTNRLILDGLHEDIMADLACQMLQVYRIPRKLERLLRLKSNGVPSWCEQLVKELLMTNVLQVGPSTTELTQPADSESQISDRFSSHSTPIIEKPTPDVVSNASKRRWSMTRHIQLAFKRAGHALSSNSSSLSHSESESRRSSENIPVSMGRRLSVDSNTSDKLPKSFEFQRGRRMSMESGKSVRICLEMNETLYPLTEQTDETAYEDQPDTYTGQHHSLASSRRESSVGAAAHSSMHARLTSVEEDVVYASPGAVPADIDDVCFIVPGMEISDVVVPNTVSDVVVARLDRMSPNEQLILKCASVLGMNFMRDLLSAIVPRKISTVLDATLYKLSKERLIECGSLAMQQAHQHNQQEISHSGHHHHHHHKHHSEVKTKHHVLCGCYADEGEAIVNLSQNNRQIGGKKKLCLYFHFSNSFVREAAYDLWLADQRKALHERAAMYLETQQQTCKSCGGSSFVPGVKSRTVNRASTIVSSFDHSAVRTNKNKMQPTSRMVGSSYPKNTLFSKVLHGDNKKILNKDELQNDTGYYSKQRQAGTRGEGIGRALVDMAGMISQGVVNETQPRNQFKSLVQKIRKKNTRVAPDAESLTRAVLAEFNKLISSHDRSSKDYRRPSLGSSQAGTEQIRANKVNVCECRCNEVLAATFHQLVCHWKAAGNKLKTFHYLIESAAAFISVHSNMQALSYLNEIEAFIMDAEDSNDLDEKFFISVEDKARVELLNGQAMMNMDRIDEAIRHFTIALKHLGNSHPTSSLGIFLRTKVAYMTQILHRKMPDTFKERSDEKSLFLIEQARCLSHLSHAYHLKHDFKRSFMVALEQLNFAEEADEDWIERRDAQEVHKAVEKIHDMDKTDGIVKQEKHLPSKAKLMTSYATMIECCQLTNRIKLGSSYEEIALEKMRTDFRSVEEILIATQLYSVLLSFRLFKGNITSAINAGYEALHLANIVNDMRVKITVIPLLSQALLLLSRVQACHEVLQEHRKATTKLEDLHGKALYFCCCLDLLIEPGRPLESLQSCINFSRKIANDPTLSSDVVPRFHLNASLALIFARQHNWKLASLHYNAALELEPEHSDMFLYCRAYAKIVEYNLLSFRVNRKSAEEKANCKEVLKKFQTKAKKYSVLLPRLFHLQAYFAYLRGKASRARLLIEDCLVASRSIEPMFEVDWAMSSKHYWFSNDAQTEIMEEYDGHTKYILPG